MPQAKNRKILTYIFLFFLVGTLGNKNFSLSDFIKVNEILVYGLDDENNQEITNNLKLIKSSNLILLNKNLIEEIIISNNLVESYYVFKEYPSSLKIKIHRTEFYARVIKDGIYYFLGSNGKLIKTNISNENIPTIVGEFDNKNFMELKKAADDSKFDFFSIKKLFFHKSGRWDLELNSGILVKLPRIDILDFLKFLILFLSENKEKKINIIDLRQKNQIIFNG